MDCGALEAVENGRVYQVNQSTVYDSVVEYHCFPKYLRQGPFTRRCMADGSWSGPDTKCLRECWASGTEGEVGRCGGGGGEVGRGGWRWERWGIGGGKGDGMLGQVVTYVVVLVIYS